MKSTSKTRSKSPKAPIQFRFGAIRRPALRRTKASPPFTFIDLFAGIGGMRLGFESVGGTCIFTSEWDEKARETYIANFGNGHAVQGDITKIDATEIPSHDLLVAGFPCQPFSVAGVSKRNALGRPHGFECKTQGTLFFDVARIIAHHRPPAFLLENVKNLKSHDGGRTFQVILETLRDELGYDVHTRVVDAKGFVPQHRERIFIVGFKRPVDFDWDQVKIPASDTGPRLSDVLHAENGSEDPEDPFTEGPKASVADKYTLTPKLWAYLQSYAEKHRKKGNGFGFGLVGPNDVARTLSARYFKDGSEILVARKNGNPRRLTPRECARLMGFDRRGGRVFKIPVSDTRAYKQFGNAVVVPVVQAIASYMTPLMLEVRDNEHPPKAKAV